MYVCKLITCILLIALPCFSEASSQDKKKDVTIPEYNWDFSQTSDISVVNWAKSMIPVSYSMAPPAGPGVVKCRLEVSATTRALAFSPTKDDLYFAGNIAEDGKYIINRWDLRQKKTNKTITTPFPTFVQLLDVAPDEKTVLAADYRGNVVAFDLENGKSVAAIKMFEKKSNWLLDIKFVDERNVLSFAHESIGVIRNVSSNETRIYHLSLNTCFAATVSHDKKTWAWCTKTLLYCWKAAPEGGFEVQEIRANDNSYCRMAISDDGTQFVCATSDSRMDLFDVASRKKVKSWVGHKEAFIGALIALRGNKGYASAADDGKVNLWDEHGELISSVSHGDEVYALATNWKGTLLASAGRGNAIIVWDLVKSQKR